MKSPRRKEKETRKSSETKNRRENLKVAREDRNKKRKACGKEGHGVEMMPKRVMYGSSSY